MLGPSSATFLRINYTKGKLEGDGNMEKKVVQITGITSGIGKEALEESGRLAGL